MKSPVEDVDFFVVGVRKYVIEITRDVIVIGREEMLAEELLDQVGLPCEGTPRIIESWEVGTTRLDVNDPSQEFDEEKWGEEQGRLNMRLGKQTVLLPTHDDDDKEGD